MSSDQTPRVFRGSFRDLRDRLNGLTDEQLDCLAYQHDPCGYANPILILRIADKDIPSKENGTETDGVDVHKGMPYLF